MKCRRALRRLADQLDRRHRHLAASDLPGLFGIMLEEVARLQRLDRRLVGGRGEMKIAGIVAVLHDAVADPSPQLGIAVERGNEAADFLVPLLRRAVGELIFDHEMLHRWLLGSARSEPQSGAGRSDNASMDKNDTMDCIAAWP